MEQTDTWQFWH